MAEIPLNAKYTLSEGKKGRWTATIGVSTYFVNKESYNYAVVETGSWNKVSTLIIIPIIM
jgi:hypothetical protein